MSFVVCTVGPCPKVRTYIPLGKCCKLRNIVVLPVARKASWNMSFPVKSLTWTCVHVALGLTFTANWPFEGLGYTSKEGREVATSVTSEPQPMKPREDNIDQPSNQVQSLSGSNAPGYAVVSNHAIVTSLVASKLFPGIKSNMPEPSSRLYPRPEAAALLPLPSKEAVNASMEVMAADTESASLDQPEPMEMVKRSLAVASNPKLVHASNTLPASANSPLSKRA